MSTAASPPTYFKIKKVGDIPDVAAKLVEYNTAVFDEIEHQIVTATPALTLEQFIFNHTYGDLLLSLGKMAPVYASMGASTVDDQKKVNAYMRSMLDTMLLFYVWMLKNTSKSKTDTVETTDWEEFKKTQNITKPLPPAKPKGLKDKMKKALADFDKEGMKLLTGLFPKDHIDHFKYREELELDDRENLEEVTESVEYEKTKKEREKYHETRLRKRLIELMTILPDNESRKIALTNLNALIASNGMDIKFKASGGMSGGDVKLLPLFEQINSTFTDNRTHLLHENIKNTMLALLQGTGLEAKVKTLADKSGSASGLLIDGVKTGLLASIAASMTAKELADKVGGPHASYQDSITTIAVMSAIAALLKSEGHAAASKNVEEAMKELEKRQKANNTQLVLSSVLSTLQSSKIASDLKTEVAAMIQKEQSKPKLDPQVALASIIGVLQNAKAAAEQEKKTEENASQIAALSASIATLSGQFEAFSNAKSTESTAIGVEKAEVARILAETKGIESRMKETLAKVTEQNRALTEKFEQELAAAMGEARSASLDASSAATEAREVVRQTEEFKAIAEAAKQAAEQVSTSVSALSSRIPQQTEIELVKKFAANAKEVEEKLTTLGSITPEKLAQLNAIGAEIANLRAELESKTNSLPTVESVAANVSGTLTPRIVNEVLNNPRLQVHDDLSSKLEALEQLQQDLAQIKNSPSGVDESRVAGIETALHALRQQIDAFNARFEELSRDKIDKTGEMIKLQGDLITLMKERNAEAAAKAGGGLKGGAPGDAPQDPIAQAKQFRKDLDEVKKTLRGITDAFGGLRGKYKKFHGTLPSEDDRNNMKAGKVSDSKRILGMYSYLNEDGRKFIDEVKTVVADKKKALVMAQEGVQKVLDSEPTNTLYLKNAVDMKRIIEGDYDKTGDEAMGVLSAMDAIAGSIQTEYDENFSVLKSAAEGIKQEKEYAIREKQQQIAPQYAAISNTNVKDDLLRAAKEKAASALDIANADKIKAEKLKAEIDSIDTSTLDTTKKKAVEDAKKEVLNLLDKVAPIIEAIDKNVKDTTSAKGHDTAQEFAKSAAEGAEKVKSLLKDMQSQLDRAKGVTSTPGTAASASKDDIVGKYFDKIENGVGKLILKDIVQKLDTGYARKLNPGLSTAMGNEPTLFMTLWNNYLSDKDEKGQMVAAKKLTEALEANNLVPVDVLKLSMIDKAIFVFVMIVIRMITLSIVSTLIMRGKLRTLPWALGAFLFIYAIIYVAFVLFINLDMYRLRIIFNFLNLHGNSANIFLHLILMWLFSFVIFTVMWNINFPLRGTKITAISDEEKADLIYRLEVLTMIVWMFLVLVVVIAR